MSSTEIKNSRPRVVIVGGGFGGLNAARKLKRARVEITLIDKRNYHLFQPLLYQVATGGLSPANIAAPLRSILQRYRNVAVMLGEITDFDLENSCVMVRPPQREPDQTGMDSGVLADGPRTNSSYPVHFDYLIVAAGASNSYFGNSNWKNLAPGLKSIEHATEIRRKILTAFELAEIESDSRRREALMTFVVVGGGPTGVELSGAIAEIARHTLLREFRHINPENARVILLDAADRILTGFHAVLSSKATRSLADLGVSVMTGTRVRQIQSDKVIIWANERESEIPTHTVFWAAGVVANSLGRRLADAANCETDRAGRLMVEPDLSVPNFDNIFVIGDMAHVMDRHGNLVPGVAPAAIQEGKYVSQRIKNRMRNRDMRPFVYRDLGNLATIGRSRAIAEFGQIRLSGRVAWLLWLFIHLMQIVQHENRLLIMLQWAWNYVTFGRSARLITGQESQERPAHTDAS